MSNKERFGTGANFATMLAVVVAFGALGISIYTYAETTKLQKHTAAFTFWQSYLQQASANPAYANGNFNESERQKYEWFASNALGSAEAVYSLQKGDPNWTATIKTVIRNHRKYIEGSSFKRNHYGPEFGSLIDEALKEREP